MVRKYDGQRTQKMLDRVEDAQFLFDHGVPLALVIERVGCCDLGHLQKLFRAAKVPWPLVYDTSDRVWERPRRLTSKEKALEQDRDPEQDQQPAAPAGRSTVPVAEPAHSS